MTNYFVCTLGEAATLNAVCPHRSATITEFLDQQSRKIPSRLAVAFPVHGTQKDGYDAADWNYDIFTYGDLRRQSLSTAKALSTSIEKGSEYEAPPGRTVALLCPSSVTFLLTWLGLMRLGFSALLIAPQCKPSAIAHLCKTCNVSLLFYDEIYEGLANAAVEHENLESAMSSICLQEHRIGDPEHGWTDSQSVEQHEAPSYFPATESDVAYLHHTSGTSTGLPKPIPQSHHCAIGVLPSLDGADQATFSTTPLYHAGAEDCFRAWTSGALIWLFPGKGVPITASNVISSLECAQRSIHQSSAPPVKYFTSVPYILQMVTAEKLGMEVIQGMDLVGVGGAALPSAVGDELVQKGVNLVSRFGSSECGFLMSSHRDYVQDREWEYLRSHESKSLRFEPQENGLAELVVLADWPHMSKRNRDDGSFATADLLEPHSTIPNAWKYHSRADSQLTLITGKKFDPAPLEDAIATSPLLSDVLVFGKGKQYPGALLFRSNNSADMPGEELLSEIWPLIQKLNNEGQGHTKLSNSMLVIMPCDAPGLEKSSKGTVLRGQAETRYQAEIDRAYHHGLDDDKESGDGQVPVPDHGVIVEILETVKRVLNSTENISEDADLFTCGVDSVACMEIRALLQRKLLYSDAAELPLNVVYDCGTIKRLSQYIINLRKGQSNEEEDEIQLMKDLVARYTSFHTNSTENGYEGESSIGNESIFSNERTIILTGATGALGAHLLDLLRSSSRYHIVCLVRASSQEATRTRVSKSLLQRGKEPLSSSDPISCLSAKLSEPELGLDPATYAFLVRSTTLIIHAAWAVNFSMRLRSFEKDHIGGLANLITLALESPSLSPPSFLFCSSVASVLGKPSSIPIPESISHDPSSAFPLGYSRSKWVAEAICEHAHLNTMLQGRIAIIRIGQLCGDTQCGIWNVTEAWPLMLSSVRVTNALPRLEHEALSWLPVDLAAQAVLEIATSPVLSNQRSQLDPRIPVFHLVNPDRSVKWSNLLDWMEKVSADRFEIVDAKSWVQRLEHLSGADATHPARKLLGLWQAAYCGDDSNKRAEEDAPSPSFSMEQTKAVAPVVMGSVPAMDEEQFGKTWKWLSREMMDSGAFATSTNSSKD